MSSRIHKKEASMEFKDISPELLEKMKACTSPEEFMQLAGEEGIELTTEMLEGINGGGVDWDNWPWSGDDDYGDTRMDIDPVHASEAYRSGKVDYAELDW